MKYELMAKAVNTLAEATGDTAGKVSENGQKIVDWFNKPAVKATGYILVATLVVAGIGYLVSMALKGLKKHIR